MSNGQSHDIRHPEMIRLDRSIAWIHYPEKTGPIAIPERRLFVVLVHVV
jgi:hypothetical protein